MDYIERIKQCKSQKKITNERLAELTGIPVSTLSKILAGFSDSPKLTNIAAICDALGCSVDYILTGIPENTNNYTLTEDEINIIEDYRALDGHGKEMVEVIINKETERMNSSPYRYEQPVKPIVVSPHTVPDTQNSAVFRKRVIPLYNLPVSAGKGEYLSEDNAEELSIPDNEKTENADFALRISGNSMEPKYRDGDILLAEDADSVEPGELGIFILDGDGFFKKFEGDRLVSLNPEYGDILLKSFENVHCVGKVIGKLRKK